MPVFGKKKDDIHSGRLSESQIWGIHSSEYINKNGKLLDRLRNTYNVYDAIDILIDEHPDVSMAFAVLQALVNQGGTIEFTASSNRKSVTIHKEWDEFAERVNALNAGGLDGLMMQLHGNDFRSGGMGCEVVVKEDLSDIEDVYPIPGNQIRWELEKRDGKEKWIPYQMVNAKKIDLSKANFLWIPYNPKETPEGTLLFKPAIPAADMQLEFFNSSQSVLYRVGSPRYDISIDKERLIASAPPDAKNNMAAQRNFVENSIGRITALFRNISVKNDIVHTDDTKIAVIGGESSAFFQGIGAYAELIDIQVMNAVKVLKTLMNRSTSGSYALSTVEFKVIVDMVEPRQRAEKRMIESIARIWLRVHGYDAEVKYTPNPIEWQTMLDKINYQLKNLEFYRRSDEYGYIDPDTAAQKTNGVKEAYAERKGLFNYISRLLERNKNESGSEGIAEEENNEGGDEN